MSGAGTSRYDTIVKLASGGMATVWVGTVRGALGFRQLVAIKKPHPHLLQDASYRNELIAEARLASLISHANVVDVRDVEVDGEEISLVMDYIEGASLSELLVAAARRGMQLPPRVAVRIALDALAGLHAAHELIDERGRHVGLVHRDISPQNILVGVDGLSRVADFGIAKLSNKKSETSEGSLKGKLAYMAPEYLRGENIDRRFDVFAVGIVLWEALAGKRLFRGANEAETVRLLLEHQPASLASVAPAAAALDGVVGAALARALDERFQNAQAMAAALESTALAAGLCGGYTEVAATLKDLVGQAIEERRTLVRAKLAHEPSVASLMGVVGARDPLATTAAAPTERDAPPTVAAPPTAVPSTLPMTPRMPVLAGAARTLGSASDPPPAGAPGIAMTTLPSGGSGAPPPSRAPAHRADGGTDTQLSFNEPSARTAHDVSAAGLPPRTSRVVPVVAGLIVVLVAVAGAAFGLRAARSKSVATAIPADVSSLAASGSANAGASAASVAAPSAAPLAISILTAAPTPSGAPVATTSAKRPVRGTTSTTTSAAATAAQPSATSKKPPPNPYAND
jgi:serine/threonine-protein kinase